MNRAPILLALLTEISEAERIARLYDQSTGTAEQREADAVAAQRADERAEAARRAARALIEDAFPGIRWDRLAKTL